MRLLRALIRQRSLLLPALVFLDGVMVACSQPARSDLQGHFTATYIPVDNVQLKDLESDLRSTRLVDQLATDLN